MPRFGFVSGSYTAKFTNVADEECINFYPETSGSSSPQAPVSLFGTPGTEVFTAFPSGPVRGICWTGSRFFAAAGDTLYEVTYDGTTATQVVLAEGIFDEFGGPVSIAASNIQLLIVAGHRAYCYPLSLSPWTAYTTYAAPSTIVDPAGHIQLATAAQWAPNTAYTIGTQIVDINLNVQQVTTAGTSGFAAPAWNAAGNTADNTVVWMYQGASNGNAGTSGPTIPTFNDAGGDTPDGGGTLVWMDQGLLIDVTPQLAGAPIQVQYSDGYFVVIFSDSNKFQISNILDGTTWPGIQVNAVSVFPENIVSIVVSHRELWVFGSQHAQPYYDSGSLEIFDVISGTLIEMGAVATFGRDLVDNTVFWISEDIRGARMAWRANGYVPQRTSTYAVEVAMSSYAQSDVANLVSYSYQENGHLFWVLYVPNTNCTWVYDVTENMWHKRGIWQQDTAVYTPHPSWNHAFAFGMHLVGDWQTGNLWEMKMAVDAGNGVYSFVTDNGILQRRMRRSPTLNNELERIFYPELKVGFNVGNGPQPPLLDGDGNPRAPEALLRWSNNSGSTWSNFHARPCGSSGEYDTFVRWQRLGYGRRRLFELTVSDPIPWAITDAWLETQ